MECRCARAGVVNMGDDPVSLAQAIARIVQDALAEVEAIPPNTIIYTESGWTVKDIVGHILTWDEQVLLSLTAYHAGSEHRIPDFSLQLFNHQRRDALKDHPAAQIYMQWASTRERLSDIVLKMTPDELAGEMTYPSGRSGLAGALVEEVNEHAQDHLKDIREVH